MRSEARAEAIVGEKDAALSVCQLERRERREEGRPIRHIAHNGLSGEIMGQRFCKIAGVSGGPKEKKKGEITSRGAEVVYETRNGIRCIRDAEKTALGRGDLGRSGEQLETFDGIEKATNAGRRSRVREANILLLKEIGRKDAIETERERNSLRRREGLEGSLAMPRKAIDFIVFPRVAEGPDGTFFGGASEGLTVRAPRVTLGGEGEVGVGEETVGLVVEATCAGIFLLDDPAAKGVLELREEGVERDFRSSDGERGLIVRKGMVHGVRRSVKD